MHTHLSALATAVVAALLASPAMAQTAAPANGPANTLDTVIVTGTRVSDRTVAESQSPIDIISAESLQATGTPELATALARALPSLNFPRPALSDGTSAIRPRSCAASRRTRCWYWSTASAATPPRCSTSTARLAVARRRWI